MLGRDNVRQGDSIAWKGILKNIIFRIYDWVYDKPLYTLMDDQTLDNIDWHGRIDSNIKNRKRDVETITNRVPSSITENLCSLPLYPREVTLSLCGDLHIQGF